MSRALRKHHPRQDILAGDDEEHAILLHNYILQLIMLKEGTAGANRRPPDRSGLRTEVRLPTGMVQGASAWVAAKDSGCVLSPAVPRAPLPRCPVVGTAVIFQL